MTKMLFLTPRNPYNEISGGTIGTIHSLEFLKKHFYIDLYCFNQGNNKSMEKTDKLSELNSFTYIDFATKKRDFKTILCSLFNRLPLSIYRNYSLEMKKTIANVINNYELVYVDHWLMMQFIPSNYTGTVILREHNAEYIMWKRRLSIEKNFLKKFYLKLELIKIKKYEKYICNKANYVLTFTENDKQALIEIGVNSEHISVLPALIISTEYNHKKNYDLLENNILYVGTMNWDANVDGLKYFLANIYPKLKEKVNDIKFYIVGKNPPTDIQKFAENDKSIILTGFVPDLKEYYDKCKLFVVYLRYGSGVKIKILEALANNIPVVSNEIGLEGIHTNAAILANSDDEFVNIIAKTIKNNETLKSLSKEALRYVNKTFSERNYEIYFEKHCK